MESFNGFNQKLNDDENPVPHGRGMSALIKYLTNRDPLKIAFIGKFIKNNKAPGTLVKDFVESIDLPSNDWWPGYLKELVNNELFELPDDYFISRAHAEWDINSAEDISKILTHTYQDLSAKMFKINLNYPDLEDTQNLKFKMIGPENDKDLSLILFSINNNKPQYIETTKLAEYEIINPKSYFSNGTGEFLAVLVNSNLTQDDYLGQSEITLEISVSQKVKTILDYKNCFFSSSLMGRYENKWADGSLHYWDEPFGIGSFNFIPGEFTGNEFVGSLTFSGYLNVATAITELTITAVISENKDEIISFEFTKVTNFNNESNEIRTEKVIGANIPLYPDRDDLFRINGLDVCNDEIKYFYEDIFYSQDGGENYVKIIEVGCTDESKLELFFAE
ncbi:MAG: hypothetical protein H6613_07650 [Ignavibacteriales bacterium]|nr:hypothetical protein [Ignavibacteriales bacterium]